MDLGSGSDDEWLGAPVVVSLSAYLRRHKRRVRRHVDADRTPARGLHGFHDPPAAEAPTRCRSPRCVGASSSVGAPSSATRETRRVREVRLRTTGLPR